MKYYIDNRDDFENGKMSNASLNKSFNKIHIGWQEKDDTMKFSHSILNKSFDNLEDDDTNMNQDNENVVDINSLINYQYLPILKIVDFGLAIYTKNNIVISKGHVGTLQYMAPEVVNGIEASYNSDLWSIGATLYECMTYECPYRYRTKWKVDKREKDNEIIKRPQIQNFSYELKYVLSKMLSFNPEERPCYNKYNKNLFKYMPLKCISEIRKLEKDYKKNEKRENSIVDENTKNEESMKENNEIVRIPSGRQIQQNNSFIEYDNTNQKKNDIPINNNENINETEMIMPSQQKTEISEMNSEENLVIDLTANKLYDNDSIKEDEITSNKDNKDKGKIINNVSSTFDPDISTISITNINDDEYECITIHKNNNNNNETLFKPKKKSPIKENEQASNEQQLTKSNNKSRSNSIKNINLFEEKTQYPQPQPQPSTKKFQIKQRELSPREIEMPDKMETYISEIDTIDINENDDDIPVNYPTTYHKKPKKLNSKSFFNSTNEIQQQNNEEEKSNNTNKNTYQTPENNYNKLFVEDIKDNEDNIIINELSDASEENHEINRISDNEPIELPKRQSKIYKFKNDKSNSTVNNNEPITLQHPSISSLPTESSTDSVIIIQSQTEKKVKRSAREPRRFIKQNSFSKSQSQNSNQINILHNDDLKTNNDLSPPSNSNDLATFNNINISNESIASLKFLSNLKEPMEPHDPSQYENSNDFEENCLSDQPKQISGSLSSNIITSTDQTTSDLNDHQTQYFEHESDQISQDELIISEETEIKNPTPKPSSINLLLNESIRYPVLKSLSTIEETSETDISIKTNPKPINNKHKKNNDTKKNISSPLKGNIVSIPFSKFNDTIASLDIHSNKSSSPTSQNEYDPCSSSSSSRKGCFNYKYCYSSEVDLNQVKEKQKKIKKTEQTKLNKTGKTNKTEKLNKTEKSNKTEKGNKTEKMNKTSKTEKFVKQKSNLNVTDFSVNNITSPIKSATERKSSATRRKEEDTNNNKKEKHKKLAASEGTDHLIHRRIKKTIPSSTLSTDLSIPNMNPFDFDADNKLEQEIMVNSATTEMDIIQDSEEKMDEIEDIPSIAYISSMKSHSFINHNQKKDKRKGQKQHQQNHSKNQLCDEEVNDIINDSHHDFFHFPSKSFHPSPKRNYPNPRNQFNEFNNSYDTPITTSPKFSTSSFSTSVSTSTTTIKPIGNDKTESNLTFHNQYSNKSIPLSNYSQSFDLETSSSPSSSSSSTAPPFSSFTSNETSYDLTNNYNHHHYETKVSILQLSTEKANSNNDIFTPTIMPFKTNISVGQQPSQHYYPYNYSNSFSNKTIQQQQKQQNNDSLKDTKKHDNDNFSTSLSSFSLNLNSILHDTNLKNSSSFYSNDLEKDIEEILSTSDEEDHNNSKYSYKWTSKINSLNKNTSQRNRG